MLKLIQQHINKVIYFSLIFISVTFPLPYKISNIGLGVLVVAWLVKFIIEKRAPKFSLKSTADKIILATFLGFFIWNIVALLYTDDVSNGWKNVEGKLTLLILPLIFYTIKVSLNQVLFLVKAFIYSIALCTVILLVHSVLSYFDTGSLLTYHEFTQSLGFHAVFYSYDIFVSILLTTYLFVKTKLKKVEKIILTCSLLLAFVGLIISASKNVLVVTTLFLIGGFIFKSIKTKVSWKEVIVLVGILLIGAIAMVKIPVIGDRIAQLTELSGMDNYRKVKRGETLHWSEIPKFNGTSMRITFWDVALNKQWRDGKMLLGYSPGDRRAVINKEFFRVSLNPWYENYNLHNQFIQVLVELGIIGLLLYLGIHFGFLTKAIQEKNFVLLAFILGILFFQLTESIIERNKGIVFIVFFLLLLSRLNNQSDENRNIRN